MDVGPKPLALFLGALGLLIGLPTASAQPGVDISRARPPMGIDSFVTLSTTRTPGHLHYSAGATFDYSLRPLILKRESDDLHLIDDRFRMDLSLEVGLLERLAVGVDIPFVLHQSVNRQAPGELGRIQSGGFGDPTLRARVRVLGDTTPDNGALPDGPGLALALDVGLPAGTEGAFAGDGAVTLGAAVIGDFHLLGLGIGGALGYRQRTRSRRISGVRFREELSLDVGARVPIANVRGLDVRAELRVATDARAPFSSSATTPVEADLSFGLRRGDVLLTSGVGFGLTDAVGSPRLRALLSLMWSPATRDADGDGIADDVDQCPHLPEDLDGFQDDDGCMDPDNDNDFVPDTDDRCPNEEALEGHDADEDGCTDPARDSDHDGVDDAADACPGEQEDMDGVEDDDGCPDPEPEPQVSPPSPASDSAGAAPADASPPTPTEAPSDAEAGTGAEDGGDATQPDDAQADDAQPDASQPDASQPDASQPDASQPDDAP